jgi:predicted nucleic-acid-binding protein
MAISIDTNVLLRLALNDVPGQFEQVIDLIDAARTNEIQVADAAFFELVWVLSGPSYGLSRAEVARVVMRIMEIPELNCNRRLFARALPMYTANKRISFVDACLVCYAELNRAVPLMTFDKDLVKAYPDSAQLVTAP